MQRFMACMGLMLCLAVPGLAAEMSPVEVVRATTHQTLDAIASQRTELDKNPEKIYQLVEDILLPAFDFDYTTRLVLGRYWRSATPEQQKQFRDAFYKFLVHTYANGLLKYDDEKVEIEPLRGEPNPRYTLVQTHIFLEDGTAVPVDYALHLTDAGWKVFDVTIEGISYVTNYRNDFGAQIEQKGLDALIARLEQQAAEARAKVGSGT